MKRYEGRQIVPSLLHHMSIYFKEFDKIEIDGKKFK